MSIDVTTIGPPIFTNDLNSSPIYIKIRIMREREREIEFMIRILNFYDTLIVCVFENPLIY